MTNLFFKDLYKKIFWLLFGAVIFLAVSYGYLLGGTVAAASGMLRLARDTEAAAESVRGLETRFLTLKQSITLDYAYEMGFHKASDIKYVTRAEKTTRLSLYPHAARTLE